MNHEGYEENKELMVKSKVSAKRTLCSLLSGAMILCSCSWPKSRQEAVEARAEASASEAEQDAALQRAATEALAGGEGTLIIMDPQTGRIRALVNPRLAFEQAFPPGSAIKPFTALIALRSGVVDRETRWLCRRQYARGDFTIVCSHPKKASPFNLVQALAYSCNDYFARIGERLNEEAFSTTLAAFGLGGRTGVNTGHEVEGRLPRSEWAVSQALGESDELLVTPIQLLTAYVALINGGRRYRPQHVAPEAFAAEEVARLSIARPHRAVLIEGMRYSIKYGTAAQAGLDSLPLEIFGKTGTSTSSNGFRNQGWFIGFAAEPGAVGEPAPDRVTLAVLVFLKREPGLQCAAVAREVFEEYAKTRRAGMAELNGTKSVLLSTPPTDSRLTIKVHLVSENKTCTVSLEEYLRGVLAAEAGSEDEIEALKAQAVISRTFALKNLKRHAPAGYDFCSTTHCQRYPAGIDLDQGQRARRARAQIYCQPYTAGTSVGGQSMSDYLAQRAVEETSGEVLGDEQGQMIESYFHAACGGMTASLETLWGVPSPAYLRSVRDDFCATMPRRNWTQTIPAAQLAAALRRDARTDVGAKLDDVVIIKRDISGRAELIALEGERRRLVRGWDFKLIVGRALGWHLLKSSRFYVRRNGGHFLFHGSGFGHGLGLCQAGAHVMARRGMTYRQILSHYFPGTALRRSDPSLWRSTWWEASQPGSDELVEAFQVDASKLSLSSEHFRVRYPVELEKREIEAVVRILERARTEIMRRLQEASLNSPGLEAVEVIIHRTTQDFVAATGQPWWVAGVTRGSRIELQPLRVLQRRGVLLTSLRHEYAHVVIEALGRGRTPRWLAEGLAAHFAGEGVMLSRVGTDVVLTRDEIERRLTVPASAEEMRRCYAAAYREVRALIQAEGETSLWHRVAGFYQGRMRQVP
jgi:stage II sporulation protein D